MGLKSFILRPYTKYIAKKIKDWSSRAPETQQKIFEELIRVGKNTAFGKDHDFAGIKTYEDFKQRVPVRDYEGLKAYVERVVEGESDVLWRGRPAYYALTSGTTSGVKYIPITKDSLFNHYGTAQIASFNYCALSGNYKFLDGNMIFFSGSPELKKVGGVPAGRLSGIVNHQVPSWLKTNQKPSYKTNCIEDWETKVDTIVEETVNANMTMVSGLPHWVQMYYEKVLEKTGKKTISEVFPNLSLYVYGGLNIEPHRAKLEALVGKKIDTVEVYPASEGFIAFQDSRDEEGLLLNTNSGIFFEFIPFDEFFGENPTRLRIQDVKTGVDYVIILSSNAGLWGYIIGDTIRFTSTSPYRVKVSGRTAHYLSAFAEHVIVQEVENAISRASREFDAIISEFTVAPMVSPEEGLPYHEWFIEFDKSPESLEDFALRVDELVREQNIYYKDLINGNLLRTLIIRPLRKNAFHDYMKSIGKLGGQNKVPRLSNDRKIADQLTPMILKEEAVA